jgi:arabinan endo-1,5-alpha-L-arabinosidase
MGNCLKGFVLLLLTIFAFSCKKADNPGSVITPVDTTTVPVVTTFDPKIADDYSAISNFSNYEKWGTYNVHDPSGIKVGNYYYVYNTDVMYGYGDPMPRIGIPFRKSKDLVHFQFSSWVFDGLPPKAASFLSSNGGKAGGVWAPYIFKAATEYRLYYAVASNNLFTTSIIGVATSQYPDGPWTDKGAVVTSNAQSGKNAIDPTVVEDVSTGDQWLAYGSCWGGIAVLQLDPSSGLAKTPGDVGTIIARREGITPEGCTVGNQEAPEIIYNPQTKKYYLFLSYDWLADSYNVRVGKADQPQGPYVDFNGNDMATATDHLPILTHAYKFENHSGWQGVGHCGILKDGDIFFMLHQGRLGNNGAIMDLHIRQIVWNSNGWPSVSPERYNTVPVTTLTKDSIAGVWETVVLNQVPLSMIASERMEFSSDNTIKNVSGSAWSFQNNSLNVNFGDGKGMVELKVLNAWDWENSRLTLVFTGLNSLGISVWGKKILVQ